MRSTLLRFLFLAFSLLSLSAYAEDSYEPNDLQSEAFDLSNQEGVWLDTINGFGELYDKDWYKIHVAEGAGKLTIDLVYTYSGAGNIDVRLYKGTAIVGSGTTHSNNELIEISAPEAGDYIIEVYRTDVGNTYNLKWETEPDDAYEPNDLQSEAFDLSNQEGVWLDTINGLGKLYDKDWYKIHVAEGTGRLTIDLEYTYSGAGNIDVRLYKDAPIVGSGTTHSNNELIEISAPEAGDYIIEVYRTDVGNTYNLKWEATALGALSSANCNRDQAVNIQDVICVINAVLEQN